MENLWTQWKSSRNDPRKDSYIIVRKKCGDVCMAKYVENSGYVMMTCEIKFGAAYQIGIIDFFHEGDEWFYLDDLKK